MNPIELETPVPGSGRAWILGIIVAVIPAVAGFALAIFIAFRAFEDGDHSCRTWWGIFGMGAGVVGLASPFWLYLNRIHVQNMRPSRRTVLFTSVFMLHFALLGFITIALDTYADTAQAIIPYPQTIEFDANTDRSLRMTVKPVMSTSAVSKLDDSTGRFRYTVIPRLVGAPAPATLEVTMREEAKARIFIGQLTLTGPFRIVTNPAKCELRIDGELVTKPIEVNPGTYAVELKLN
jgi:hypothetical protein